MTRITIFDTSDFDIEEEPLGNGQFGAVYKVRYNKNGNPYAAKIIISDVDLKTLKRELNILALTDHRAIVKFVGYTLESIIRKTEIRPTLITEYMEKGSLETQITNEEKGNADTNFNSTKKKVILIGIADAMRYLHDKGIVHRDLKPSNVLLDDLLYPKICDFGLSRILSNSESENLTGVGTPRFWAPEVKYGKYGKSADVYSFGMLAYELVTNDRVNFDLESDRLAENMSELISRCTDNDPLKRPDFKEIYEILTTEENLFNETVDESEVENYIEDLNDDEKNRNSDIKRQEMEKEIDKNQTFESNNDQIIKLLGENKTYLKLLKTTLEQAKNTEKIEVDGQPILHFACKLGNMELIQTIVSVNKIKLELTDRYGSTILHVACRNGNLKLVKYLIEDLKMEKDYKNYDKLTILHFACASGNIQLIKYLIDKKRYDIYARSVDGLNIFHFACQSGNENLIKYLFSDPKTNAVYTKFPQTKNRALISHFACTSGNPALIEYLLNKHQFKIDAVDDNKTNLLHYACLSGKCEMMDCLLSKPNCPDVCDRDKNDKTLWHFAAESGSLKLFKHLKTIDNEDFRSMIEAKTKSGKTVLYYACSKGNSVLVEHILREHTALFERSNRERETLLDICKTKKFTKIEQILLEKINEM